MRRIPRSPRVAVVGATGAVGLQMVKLLAERAFPGGEPLLLASDRAQDRRVPYGDKTLPVEPVSEERLSEVDLALFAVDAGISRELIPGAVAAGAVCIDKSSAYRGDPDVPLVVPEVNRHALRRHNGIIASPNCTTIQLVVAMKPLHDAAGIRQLQISTYQSVSGTGRDAVMELADQAVAFADRYRAEEVYRMAVEDALGDPGGPEPEIYPHPIFGNVIPHIDSFGDHGYTGEEWKLMGETRRILELPELPVSATCVRVPAFIGHALSVHVTTERTLSAEMAREILRGAESVHVCDDCDQGLYPMPITVAGQDGVYVGRIRVDLVGSAGLIMWIAADNLRKGAATNALQIAEDLLGE